MIIPIMAINFQLNFTLNAKARNNEIHKTNIKFLRGYVMSNK